MPLPKADPAKRRRRAALDGMALRAARDLLAEYRSGDPEETAIELFRDGKTDSEVARLVGVGIEVVEKYRRRFDGKEPKRKARIDIADALSMANSGKMYKEIAAKYECSLSAVTRALRRARSAAQEEQQAC